MSARHRSTARLLPLLVAGLLVLAACAPAATTNLQNPTEEAMHMAETEDAMHMAETEDAMHMSETEDAMHMSETEDAMHMSETEEARHMSETEEAMHMSETEEAGRMSATEEARQAEETRMASQALSLHFEGLEDLGPGWAYEGWLIVEGQPVSTGTFDIDADGMATATEFTVDAADLEAATTFVLTIEPDPDPDPAPSEVHVLAGDFEGDKAELAAGHMAALGDSFADASGSYVLAAPTGGDHINGLWFLNLDGGPVASLVLPTLPAGWVYEGWVVGPDGPLSTGRFLTAAGEDSDGAGPAAGPQGHPPFPGQDFVNPPLDLTGYAAVISIEPEPDNGPAPFAFKPLVDATIEDTGPGEAPQALTNMAGGFPTGSAQR